LKSLFSARAPGQLLMRCRHAPGVPGIRLHYGSRRAGSGHTLFDGEQGHQGGKMKTLLSILDPFSLACVTLAIHGYRLSACRPAMPLAHPLCEISSIMKEVAYVYAGGAQPCRQERGRD
jgi:hypothetical protein